MNKDETIMALVSTAQAVLDKRSWTSIQQRLKGIALDADVELVPMVHG